LLSNAMKFTSSGHIKLQVVQVEEGDSISRIKFSVIDTGIGIKDHNQKKIFQSFIQADNTTTRKYGGTGLGLAISSQLLALKNSELHLVSSYGVGSEFFFVVTYEKILHKTNGFDLKNSLNSHTRSQLLKKGPNFKVLIAEDNKINMLLAKTLIKKILNNCDLIEASNGSDAVILADEKIPDLILMDIQMPIQNGYDATLEIRKNEKTKHIPVIALTAGVLNGEKEKCMEYGMSDYVTKPIIQDQLETVLLKWLKN
jgi:CheY-like chemotaxis protein